MKKLFTILVSLTFLLFPNLSKASHYAGADLTYTCLGGNTYQITYTFYRDCSGITAPNSVTVHFNCTSNSNLNLTQNLQKISGTGQEITHACSAVPTKCSGYQNINYGIQEYVYQGTVTLAPCNSWRIYTYSCCRNPATTVPNNTSNGWYNLAVLNNLSAPGNSSPTFSSNPVSIVCNGQTAHINAGAVDPDGDFLIYSFYPAMTNPISTVTYTSPYSYDNFLLASAPSGITIDSLTGDISFTPTTNLSTVYGIKVREYRIINGTPTLIGTIYRDFQLRVVSCSSNNLPRLSGIDTSMTHTYSPNDTIYYMEACFGPDPIEFDINGFDPDTFNSATTGSPEKFSISWNSGIASANFTTHYNGTDSAYAHFSWTPTAADVGIPRSFTVTIQDSACPYNGVQTYSYWILIKDTPVQLGSDTTLCNGESLTVNAIADSSVVNYHWMLNGNPTGTPLSQDSFIFNSTNYGLGHHTLSVEVDTGNIYQTCKGYDQIDIFVAYLPNINGSFPDTTFCGNNPVTFDAGPGQTYVWKDVASNIVDTTQFFTTSTSGLYTVVVDGGYNTRCRDTDTFVVNALPAPQNFSFGNDTTIAASQTLTLIMPAGYSNYLWSTGATTQSIVVDSSYNWINKIWGKITLSNQCYSSDTIRVYIGSVGVEQSEDSPFRVYPNPVGNVLYIELKNSYPESMIEIFDLNGKQIRQEKFSGQYYQLKSLETLPKGTYILHLQNNELNVLLRFIKE